jgi:hypothetical protein
MRHRGLRRLRLANLREVLREGGDDEDGGNGNGEAGCCAVPTSTICCSRLAVERAEEVNAASIGAMTYGRNDLEPGADLLTSDSTRSIRAHHGNDGG